MPNIDNIQDIKLEDVNKKENKDIFSATEISDEKLEKTINEDLEWLWGKFFQWKNKEELKKLVNQNLGDKKLLEESEKIFDEWVNENQNIVDDLLKDINLEEEKKQVLIEYLNTDENLNLTDLALKTLKSQIKNSNEKLQNYEVPQYSTNELIKDTVMYNKLKEEMGRDEAQIEKFGNQIHKVIDTYFSPNLDFVDQKVRDSMNVAVQFALMEELTNMGEDEAKEFFKTFGKANKKSNSKMFFRLITAFNIWWGYLKLWKRIENLKRYLVDNKVKYGNGTSVQELTNPVKCKNLLSSDVLDNYETIKNTLQLTIGKPEENVNTQKLTEIANNKNIPITKSIIKKIQKSLTTAEWILSKRNDLYTDISWTYTSLSAAVEGVVWSMGWMAKMLGIKTWSGYLIDMLWKPDGTIRKIVDFILGLIGFSGGLEGVHKEYIKNNINKWIEIQPERKAFISQALKFYQTHKTTIESQTWHTTFDNIPELKALKEEDKQMSKNKIPENYALLSGSLQKAIKENPSALNVNIVKSLGMAGVKYTKKTVKNSEGTEEKIEVVESIPTDENIINWFIDKYLKKAIPELMKNQKFMKKITSPDDFAFALMGNLVLDHFFVEGVALGLEDKSKYWGVEKVQNNSEDENKESNDNWNDENAINQLTNNLSEAKQKQIIENELKKAPFTSQEVIESCNEFNIPWLYGMAFMKNDSSYWTAWKWAKTRNPGNVWNTDDWSTRIFKTWKEGIDAVSKNLQRRIEEYRKVYGSLSIPTVKELADNIWPDGKGFLSSQANYKQKNSERMWAYMTAKNWWNTVQKIYNSYIA